MKIKLKNFCQNMANFTPPKILIIILLTLTALITTFLFFRIDNDFWFLINLGEEIIKNGFMTIEPFTIHLNLTFIPQQWLSDIVFYFIYHNFSVYGIYILVMIFNLMITFLIYKISNLINDNKTKLSLITTFLTSTLLSLLFVTTRPQMFDILLFLIEIYLLELYIKKEKKCYLIGLPIVSLLLINLHASIWLMLFVFLIPYFLDCLNKFKFFQKDNYKLKPLLITTIIMFLVGFLNPYFDQAILYLFNSYGVSEINSIVGEMKAPLITTVSGIYVYGYIFLILISYYVVKKINLRYFLLFLGTTFLALSHLRGLLFLIIASVLSLNYNFKDKFKKRKTAMFYQYRISNIVISCFAIIMLILYSTLLITFDFKEKTKPYLFEIANYLDENATKEIKVYTGYDDGGYLEYRGYKCYLDPRAEVFLKANNQKEDILNEYYKLQAGYLNYEEFLDKYNFDYLVVSENDLLYYNLDEITDYEIVFDKKLKKQVNIISYRIYKRVE